MNLKGEMKRESGSFLTLLLCLIGLMLAAPFAETNHSPFVVDVVTTVVFFVGMWSLLHNRNILWLGFITLLPAVISRWLYAYTHIEIFLYISSISTAVFMMFNSFALFRYILKQREPHPDTIYGGICIYLFLGFLWGELYLLTELTSPGSFSIDTVKMHYTTMKSDLTYFSFVTLATLGYGEITPVGNMARTLAIIEAVLGQMFVAVFIARLVGFHMSAPSDKEQK